MEEINITIQNDNVNIDSNCSQNSLMNATSVLVTSMAQNSSNTLKEIIEIIETNAIQILEQNCLKTTIEEKTNDI